MPSPPPERAPARRDLVARRLRYARFAPSGRLRRAQAPRDSSQERFLKILAARRSRDYRGPREARPPRAGQAPAPDAPARAYSRLAAGDGFASDRGADARG